MPPKPQKPSTSKKQAEKKTQKVIEDKTFGLKNKKGAKMQKYIANIEKQVQSNARGNSAQLAAAARKKKEEEERDEMRDITKIFKPVQAMPKVIGAGRG